MHEAAINRPAAIGNRDVQLPSHSLAKEVPVVRLGVLRDIVDQFTEHQRHRRLHVGREAGLRLYYPLENLLRPVVPSASDGKARDGDVALMRIGLQQVLGSRLKDVKRPLETDRLEVAIHMALHPDARDHPPAFSLIDGKRSQVERMEERRLREVPFDSICGRLRLMNNWKQRIEDAPDPVVTCHVWNNYTAHIGRKAL